MWLINFVAFERTTRIPIAFANEMNKKIALDFPFRLTVPIGNSHCDDVHIYLNTKRSRKKEISFKFYLFNLSLS